MAFSSLRDLSARDTLRDFFLLAAGFAGAFSCSPNENIIRPGAWWVGAGSVEQVGC